MQKDATLKQAKKALEIFEDMPAEKFQAILGFGIFADLRDCDPSKLTPDARRLIRLLLGVGDPIVAKTENDFIRLISGGESIVIDPTDGREILADANDLFTYIDPDLRNWRADEPGRPTAETAVEVYEMKKDATFEQMFGFFGVDKRQLCLTQAQIKSFVRNHRQWLRDGYGTFFPFESYGRFFVAYVLVLSDGRLEVYVFRLGYADVWGAGSRHRLVLPQLA